MLIPRQKVPALAVDTLDHGRFELAAETPERGTVVSFYRGLHCPICATYIKDLEKRVPAFAERGYGVIAISSDDEDRARKFADKIGAERLRIGYGLPLARAREWGLYISTGKGATSAGVDEPELFPEPGLFVVNRDGTLYAGSVQTMPFARPSFAELLGALDFVIAKDLPGARGIYRGGLSHHGSDGKA
ncbi:MAG TPA: peroxiredoxin-like family protein [Thermohalobaculum sp.]|nr:peroxiredoxin-like family protein [Thermohalobaculum sp.]